ncbi:MAG: DUF554 domain-containing protein [Anaerolineaceae bacterium]|nr:DUF554 domain-containing protein [Anaerolineaceae bacterium]
MIGTWINIAAVLVGGGLGTLLGPRLPERMRQTVLHGLGLVTLVVGIHLTTETQNILIVMGSILVGAILGEWWKIDLGLEWISERLKERVSRGLGGSQMTHFTEGFVTASLVFCIGPMTILGSIADGLTGDIRLLAIKSVLDGFAALAFAASLGVGVLFSALTVLIYQGGLTLLAGLAQSALNQTMVAEMTATGGVMILAIGLLLLDLKKIRVANLLPALLIAPLIVAALQLLGVIEPGVPLSG